MSTFNLDRLSRSFTSTSFLTLIQYIGNLLLIIFIFRKSFNTSTIFTFIGKLDIFPLMCVADKVWLRSVCNFHVHYDVMDKTNNISSEGVDRHDPNYPRSSYQTYWDNSDNVCLCLQDSHYSIFTLSFFSVRILIFWHTCLKKKKQLYSQ